MGQPLSFKKHLRKKLELGITFFLFFYYLVPNVPTPIYQAWALLGFITVPLLILGQWKRFIWVTTRDLPLLLLTAVVPISILWSTSPDSTLGYSRAFLCSTAFGIYLATRYTSKEQMRLLVYLFGISIFLNLIAVLIIPSYGIADGAWQGITRYKNHLAAIMVMTTTLFLDISLYGRRYRWAALIGTFLAFLILLFSGGKGSLGIFVGLLPLLPLYKIVNQEYRLRTVFAICVLVIAVVITVPTLANLEYIVVDLLGKDLGGHGRDEVWDYLIQRALEKPWLGYGYGGFWSDPTEGLGVALRFPWIGGAGQGGGNAHSSYLETFLQLGWLGLSLLILSILTVLSRVVFLLGLTKQIEFFWMLQLLLIVAISSSEDAIGFLDYRNLFWVLYVSCAYLTAVEVNRVFKTNKKLVKI